MPMDFLYKGAYVIDPVNGIDEIRDIAVHNGVFAKPDELVEPAIVNVSGKVLCPGFTDVHVHLRDPGQLHKETLETGTAAAAAGGFTSILAMPNTTPPMDTPERIAEIMQRAASAPVRVYQSACLTKGRDGQEMADLEALAKAGVPAFSDDGSTPQQAGLMRQIMEKAATLNIPVIDHCEDKSLSAGGVMHAGECAKRLGFKGQPRSAEELIVARDIMLAAETGCRLHLQHLSSKGSIAMLRRAKAMGIPVSGEATPHHLLLTDKAVEDFGPNAKMAPPLREEEDRQALIEAIGDGTISIIATDHAPHTQQEKAKGMENAPFGIVGIEVAISLCLTELYGKGLITLPKLVSLFTAGPRELLSLPLGAINYGERADITLLDLEQDYVVNTSDFLSKGCNCPYQGWCCKGKAYSILNGIPNSSF
ncbi:MAG: dihydroorotase [Victivallales bacterium]|nr:dihydroorotase [Victivallales bacterium]